MSKSEPSSYGVKCFTIAGRTKFMRQRCLGMTDEERRWRAQWLKDQVLSPDEPREVPEYYKAITNPLRRLWKTPFNLFEKKLQPLVGYDAAYIIRNSIGKGAILIMCIYLGVYYVKYHSDDFSKYRSLEVFTPRKRMYPDDPDYPNYPVKEPYEYYDQGFYSSVLCQDVEIEEPPPPPPPPKVEQEVICPALAQESA